MKKTILLIAMGLGFISTSLAQNIVTDSSLVQPDYTHKANIGSIFWIVRPLGNDGDLYETGIGGNFSFDYYINNRFHIGAEVGLISADYNDPNGVKEHLNLVPVVLTAGVHTDLGNSIDLYGEIAGGKFNFATTVKGEASKAPGGISPRIGIAFNICNDKLFMDINTHYIYVFKEAINLDNYSSVGFGIGLLYTVF